MNRQHSARKLRRRRRRTAARHRLRRARIVRQRRLLVRNLLARQRRAAHRGHFPQHIELARRALRQFEKCGPHFVRAERERMRRTKRAAERMANAHRRCTELEFGAVSSLCRFVRRRRGFRQRGFVHRDSIPLAQLLEDLAVRRAPALVIEIAHAPSRAPRRSFAGCAAPRASTRTRCSP